VGENAPRCVSNAPPKRISSVGARCRTGKRKSRRLLLTSSILPIYAEFRRVTDGTRNRAFGATMRRYLFPEIAGRCRIALDKSIPLLTFDHRFSVSRPE
jgi:hypothetical protein